MINNVIDLKWIPSILVYKACTRRGRMPRSRTGSGNIAEFRQVVREKRNGIVCRAHRNDSKVEIDLHSPFPEYIPYNLANVTSGSNYEGYNRGLLSTKKFQV